MLSTHEKVSNSAWSHCLSHLPHLLSFQPKSMANGEVGGVFSSHGGWCDISTIQSECTLSVKKSMYSIFPPKFPKSFKHLEKCMQNIRVLLMTTLATELSTYFKSNLMSYVMGSKYIMLSHNCYMPRSCERNQTYATVL